MLMKKLRRVNEMVGTVMDVIAPLDEKTKGDTIDLYKKTKNERGKFLDALRLKEAECFKLFKPFSFRAAKADFEEKQNILFKRGIRGKDRMLVEDVPVDGFDLRVYENSSRFKLLSTKDIIEKKIIDGISIDAKTGVFKNYQDIKYGNRINIREPLKKEDGSKKE